ncbi:methyltransferase domain-containing protein [Duganella sp. CY15W]|uniref:class I SAM-dependent methyltransferase n=1 Tax=Duganella sp. CY15W TaxID=2692172 RepID=UPI00136D3695|nr:class I SAM-dependent methyltransferase [Duganella sp. CY15W]MYM30725.1 methyltransferase domain-containing protein [Duganella sp. CY15W]
MDTNQEQATLWNGVAGRAWIDKKDVLDDLFQPVTALLLEEVCACAPTDVLDIGCGTGATTLALSQRLRGHGHVTGIDISATMIATANAHADADADASFICADAQTYAFTPASYDVLMSRFGVMFFEDPVSAFRNLRTAATSQAKLRLAAWRSPAENPFMTMAEQAAAPFLPPAPARAASAPGQFGFADRQHVQAILEQSGWQHIEIGAIDLLLTMPEQHLQDYFTRMGQLGRMLDQLDESTRQQIITAVRAAFAPFVHGDEVRFTAACWLIRADAASAT